MHTVFVCPCADKVCLITASLAVESFSLHTIVCKFFQFDYVLAKTIGFHNDSSFSASAFTGDCRKICSAVVGIPE